MEEIVIFVVRIVAIAKLHPSLKNREVEIMWFTLLAPEGNEDQGWGRQRSP